MSKPTRWALVCAACLAGCAFIIACASGGASGNGDDVGEPMDAPVSTQKDASVSTMTDAPPVKMDGSVVTQDATMPQPDAPPSSLFCSSNAQCTNAGECCFAINGQGFCVPGTVIINVCFPI
jgi:hypothetical protein